MLKRVLSVIHQIEVRVLSLQLQIRDHPGRRGSVVLTCRKHIESVLAIVCQSFGINALGMGCAILLLLLPFLFFCSVPSLISGNSGQIEQVTERCTPCAVMQNGFGVGTGIRCIGLYALLGIYDSTYESFNKTANRWLLPAPTNNHRVSYTVGLDPNFACIECTWLRGSPVEAEVKGRRSWKHETSNRF